MKPLKGATIFTAREYKSFMEAQKLRPLFFFDVQVMTPNPECATLDTTLVDALHTMHDGKFLHLPVTDRGKHQV